VGRVEPICHSRSELLVFVKLEDRQAALDDAQSPDPAVHMRQLMADQPRRWSSRNDLERLAFEILTIDHHCDGPDHLTSELD
jgi:hypothetical protein